MNDGLPTPSGDNVGGAAPTDRAEANMSALAFMTAQLDSLRRQRKRDEREAAQLPTLLNAIALVRRDRDAGTSRRIRACRAQLEHVCADVEAMVVAVACAAVRIHVRGDDGTDPVVHRARRAIDSAVKAMGSLAGELETAQ